MPKAATTEDLSSVAAEAEAGYDIGSIQMQQRPRGRAEVVPVRVPPELKERLEARADSERTSVSEIVRAALRALLDDSEPDPPATSGAPQKSRPRPSEADTCRDYVRPRLNDAGWTDEQIVEQYPITAGRIIKVGSRHRRATALRADYVLEYEPGVPIGVVEAKREYSTPGKGMQQAKNYAQLLDLPFAYSTNGVSIVEDDRNTGIERANLAEFPSPDVLWARYREWKGIKDDSAADGLLL
ncbi:MAG: ribbon-helix-helix protein, CopG family, partial [Acidimicrobiales bacterium]